MVLTKLSVTGEKAIDFNLKGVDGKYYKLIDCAGKQDNYNVYLTIVRMLKQLLNLSRYK